MNSTLDSTIQNLLDSAQRHVDESLAEAWAPILRRLQQAVPEGTHRHILMPRSMPDRLPDGETGALTNFPSILIPGLAPISVIDYGDGPRFQVEKPSLEEDEETGEFFVYVPRPQIFRFALSKQGNPDFNLALVRAREAAQSYADIEKEAERLNSASRESAQNRICYGEETALYYIDLAARLYEVDSNSDAAPGALIALAISANRIATALETIAHRDPPD